MSFFSNTQETAGRYGKYIPEFQELFRKYEVNFGTPQDFLRLPSKLAYDGDLRAEFSVLAKSVGEREEGRLSLMQILTIIAVAAGGTEIEEVGSSGAVPISLLVVFLSEMGGWQEAEPEPEPELADVAQGEGDEAAELERRLAQGHKEGLEGVTASLFTGPGLMKETLSRLEMNALQLKMHLDNIDTRMERIEPHLDDLAWRVTTQAEAATEERKRKTGTSEERPSRFSPDMRPWPARREEDEPGLSREMPAPSMRPFPVDREKDLEPVGESLVEAAAPPPATDWRSAVASLQERERRESMLRATMPEPVLESVPEPVAKPPLISEPDSESSASEAMVQVAEMEALPEPVKRPLPREPLLRAPLAKEAAPEPLLRERPVRVPFGEYLRDEDEEISERRWGRWVLAGLLVVAVAGGALVYRSQGWQGFIDGWQQGKALAGAAVAKARLAVDEAKELSAKPAPSATPTQSTGPAGAEAGAAPAPQSSAPPVPQPVPTQAAPVTAAQPPGSTTPAAAASSEAGQKTATPAKIRGRVVVEESGVGGGTASSSREAITAPVPSAARVFGGAAAPAFVEASRLTVLSKTQPDYPKDAAAQKITGDVVVQAIVSRTGAVESAQIVSGPPGLLKASLDAMKSWRYQPYLVNGVPVEVRTYVKFRFEPDE